MKRSVSALILAVVLCAAVMVSCTKSYKGGAMYIEESGNVSVNYLYLLAASQKATYAEVVNVNADGDWNATASPTTGKTYLDVVSTLTVESAKSALICEYLHDKEFGLTLSKEVQKGIDDSIDALIKTYGSKNALSEALSAYSADIDSLRRYYTLSAKQLALYSYLFGDNGIMDIEDDVKRYFTENYAIVTHIYINTGYKTKDDGTTVSLTEEEAAEKRAFAGNLYSAILAGDDFYAMRDEYSEDTYESEYFPNGFFVSSDTSFPPEFTSAALEMKEGELRLVECADEVGTGIHIMLKLPMDETLYNTNQTVYEAICGTVLTEKLDEMMVSYAEKVTVDEEELDRFNAALVPALALEGN